MGFDLRLSEADVAFSIGGVLESVKILLFWILFDLDLDGCASRFTLTWIYTLGGI